MLESYNNELSPDLSSLDVHLSLFLYRLPHLLPGCWEIDCVGEETEFTLQNSRLQAFRAGEHSLHCLGCHQISGSADSVVHAWVGVNLFIFYEQLELWLTLPCYFHYQSSNHFQNLLSLHRPSSVLTIVNLY